MASIYAIGSNGHHRITLNVSSGEQSSVTNTTIISYSVVLTSETTGYGWDYQTNPFVCTYTINSVVRTCTLLSYNGSSSVTLDSGTQEVVHNEDGTKTIDYSFSVTSTDDPNLIGSCSNSGSLELTNITRISTFTVPSGTLNVGSPMTITITKPSSLTKHTLTYKCGSATGVIGSEKTTETTLSWTPPTDLVYQDTIRNTLECVLTLKTYYSQLSSLVIGTQTQTITLSIPIQLPSVNTTLIDTTPYMMRLNPPPITNPFYITLSSLKFYTGPQCYNGAKLKSSTVVFRQNDSSGTILAQGVYDTVTEWPLGLWDWTGTVYMKITATDSRGNVGEAEKTFKVYPYYFPVITTFTVGRYADSAGTTPSDGGAYCKVTYAASVTSIVDGGSERNPGTVTIKYKTRASSTWTTAASSSTMSGSTVFQADIDTAYDVQITADDRASSGLTKSTILSTGHVFMDWREDGTGLAFGGESTRSNALEVRWPKIIINSSSPQFVAQGSGATSLHFIRDDYNAESLIYQWASSDNPGVSFGLKAQGDSEYTYPAAITKDGIRPYSANSFSLGLSNVPWLNIFGGTIYEGGTSLANKYNAKIVKITDSSGSTTVASGSYVECSSKAITTAGYYMVVGYQDWASGFTGTTTFRIVQKRGTTSQSTWAWRHDATGGGGISGIALLQIAANDTINTEVYQSSGSNKTARTYIYAFRLMD